MALALLFATLVILGLYTRGSIARSLRVVKLDRLSYWQRDNVLKVIRQLLAFGLPSVVALALLGRIDAFWTMPREFGSASATSGETLDDSWLLVVLAVVAVIVLLKRRWINEMIGRNLTGLLPRNRAELPYGVLLSLSAGVTEEAMFRLLLPLLIILVTGSWIAAFLIPLLIFGAMHRYQGWVGVIATTFAGAVLTAFYLVTQSILMAMLVHVVIDLNALVIRPLLRGALRPARD